MPPINLPEPDINQLLKNPENPRNSKKPKNPKTPKRSKGPKRPKSSEDPKSPETDSALLTKTHTNNAAVNLCPEKIGNQLWYYPQYNRVLKKGHHVRVSEAMAMRLLSSRMPRVPVPKVYAAYERDGQGYIIMDKAHGQPLWTMWDKLANDEKGYGHLVQQLSEYVRCWRSLSAPYYGSVTCIDTGAKRIDAGTEAGTKAGPAGGGGGGQGGPCKDVFFVHLPALGRSAQTYGPYHSRTEYNRGLIDALKNARPEGAWSKDDQMLADRLSSTSSEDKVFSHGDLYPDNIFVDDELTITAILDWGASGYSIPERESFEARSRANHPIWAEIVKAALPDVDADIYQLLEELNQALRLYSGI